MLPLFKSHYSISKSILTLEKADTSKQNGPDSIIDIALENNLKEVWLVEDSMTGFMEAYKNCQESKLNLRFGVRLTLCENMEKKDEDSLKTHQKIIVFMRNTEGYKDLIKLYSKAATEGFYYLPRLDCKVLKKLWNKDNLSLSIPFYDSFIFKNSLYFDTCIPEFEFTEPTFFIEDNGLPFDYLIKQNVEKYSKASNFETVLTKSIYYKKREDFKAFMTFKCIHNRTSLEKPNLEHMSSAEFCFESYLDYGRTPTTI